MSYLVWLLAFYVVVMIFVVYALFCTDTTGFTGKLPWIDWMVVL